MQAAFGVAAGRINGQQVTIGGQEVLIKGTTILSEHTWREERQQDQSTVVETHTVTRRTPLVTTIDSTSGAIVQYQGDAGMAALMDIPDAADSLIAAVGRSAPPRYQMQLPPALAPLLAGIVPQSGRALPGQRPGLLPMQQHLVAALWTAFTQPDTHSGRVLRNLVLSAEMGSGKTACGIATAEALACTAHRDTDRAFTVIVVAPNHLVGERGQESPPPPWLAEWRDLLHHWRAEILETPAQVAAFFRGARFDTTPRVGFLSLSKASLGSGWEVAAIPLHDAPPAEAGSPRAAFYARLEAAEAADIERLVQEQRLRRQAQRVSSANGETPASVQPVPATGTGVSQRTIRRDQLLRCGTYGRGTPLPCWGGVACPDCGRRLVGQSVETLRRAGIIGCPGCGGRLGQLSRDQDNVGDRALQLWRNPTWQTIHPAVPWGQRPRSNPRVALGRLIARRYPGQVDLFLCDEVHLMKGKNTARGGVFGQLVAASRRTLGMTGTLYGGKASTVFWLLKRMGCAGLLEYGWDQEATFVREMGVVDTVTRERVSAEDAQALSGKATRPTVQVVERAGITAELAAIVQSQAVLILLRQMGFVLPTYDEQVVFLEMPSQVADEYTAMMKAGKALIREPGGQDALSSYLQAMLTYCLCPWRPVPIHSPSTGLRYQAPTLAEDLVLPHHEWLADLVVKQMYARRRVLIFAEHTGKLDLMPDVVGKLAALAQQRHGVRPRTAILRASTVSAGQRAAWFARQEQAGTHVAICHPQLVETGLNLIGWPEIVFLEPTYKLATALQARKRAMRPTQTRPCRVTWLAYAETMMEQAIAVVGAKATAASLLAGDDLSSGLLQFDPGMSLLQELARRVLRGEMPADASLAQAAIVQAGAALRGALVSGDLTIALTTPVISAASRKPRLARAEPETVVEQEARWKEVVRSRSGQQEDEQVVQFTMF